MINRAVRGVKFGKSKYNRNKSTNGVPFVNTYHPMLKSLGKVLPNNIHLLYMNEEVRRTFAPEPMISFKTHQKSASYFVRARLHPSKKIVGSRKCSKKRFEVCENINNSNNFTSSVIRKDYKIYHRLKVSV